METHRYQEDFLSQTPEKEIPPLSVDDLLAELAREIARGQIHDKPRWAE